MILRKAKAFIIGNGPFYAVGIFIAMGLKYHYSRANIEDLDWILVPTIRFVELLSGIRFERELNAGFINHAHRMIIVPSCAGINFLTIAFSTLFFSAAYRMRGNALKLLCLGISLELAYLLTIGVNALRIMTAIHLNEADIYGGWITQARVHRIEGTLIYFFFLLMVYPLGERIAGRLCLDRSEERKLSIIKKKRMLRVACACLIPFFWYALFVLGIPALNMAYRQNGTRFMEHCLWVLSACLSLLVLFFLLHLGYHKATHWLGRRDM
jgi:exosortase K